MLRPTRQLLNFLALSLSVFQYVFKQRNQRFYCGLRWYKIDVICVGLMGSPNLLANTQVKCLLAWCWFKFIVHREIYCLIQGQSFSLLCQCPLMFCLTDYLNPIIGCRNSILHLLQLLVCPQRSYIVQLSLDHFEPYLAHLFE